MKNLYLVMTLFLLPGAPYKAQSTNASYEPKVYPVSPAVADIGKYGTYPVNLSTGLPAIEIPLYTVKSGDLELPIKLMYHASGIKVGQEAGWVGLGWSLSSGGQVNVDVRDTPDENEPGVYDVPTVNDILNHTHSIIRNDYVNNRSWVKDGYQIQLPTVSGEFYRGGSNDNDLKFPKDDYRIKWKTGGPPIDGPLEITDSKGIQYFFQEEEKAVRATNPGQETYTSSYLLTKILRSGNMITIDYQNQFQTLPFYNYSQTQSYTVTEHESPPSPTTAVLEIIQNTMFTNLPQLSKKVSEINFDGGRIRFVLGQNLGSYAGKYLDHIIVEKNTASAYQTLKIIRFHYSTFTGSGRLKLVKVVEESAGDDKLLCELKYNENPLPALNSFSQDYFGYFNGKSNADLIPKTYIKPNTFFGSADRQVNTTTNQNGILTEIIYPTKGKTVFEYETNSFFGQKIHYGEPINIGSLHLDNIGNGSTAPGIGEVNFNISPPANVCSGTCSFNYCCEGTKSLTYDLQDYQSGKILINYNITTSSTGTIPLKYAYAKIYVRNNGNTYYKNIKYGQGTEEFSVTEGNIQCELVIWGHTLNANVDFQLVPSGPKDLNTLAGGLRVKSITNYDSNNAFIDKKGFEYNIPGTSISSGKLNNPNLNLYWDNNSYYLYTNNGCCASPEFELICPTLIITKYNFRRYGSNSNGGQLKNNMSYEYVTEKNLDQNGISKGRKITKFSIGPDVVIDGKYSVIMQNNDYKRGNMLEELIYDSNNNLLSKAKNTYTEDPSRSSVRKDLKVFMHKDQSVDNSECVPLFSPADAFEVVSATIIVPRQFLKNHEETHYFGNKSVTVTKEFMNENLNTVNLTKEIITYSDSTNKTISYRYAHENGNQYLIDKNMIGVPVETTIIKRKDSLDAGKTTSQVLIQYPASQAEADLKTSGLPLPYEILSKSLQNTNMGTEVTYDRYDTRGNLLQYTSRSGIPTTIIWGYGSTQPVAKIEGATYDQIQNDALVTAVVVAAENDQLQGTVASEQALIAALDSLRKGASFGNYQITTYTYDPLIGVRSFTAPSGIREVYIYDTSNRLKEIREGSQTGNILKEFKYNYKP
ncbi:hypothetical protein [Chryseobacterium sp.]|uniref:hypothetical protein n=1 Tax=Chryseobacterium sp. TaxID=1871047 RepID=UPI0011CA5F5B|nr:hypothetical protein [Chryseobacterium sp.]TXF77773.1 hypothetical protein FUA25_07575 [Chryseobacterium sp.]